MMFDRGTKFLLLVPEERDGIINVKLIEQSMIKGVKVIRQFGKDNRVTEFTYKDYHGGCLTEDFNKMTIADFEKLVDESHEWQRKCDEAIKRIETQRAAMTPEERAGWDEADRAVFER